MGELAAPSMKCQQSFELDQNLQDFNYFKSITDTHFKPPGAAFTTRDFLRNLRMA
jgi:hypothetical protein